MNIALVILHADPAKGGAERYTHDLAVALANEGHSVSLLASSFGRLPAKVESIDLPASGATRLGRYLRFLSSLEAHLEEMPYDIVHAMLPVRRCDVYHPHAGIAAQSVAEGHLQHEGVKRSLIKLGNRLNAKRRRFASVERRLLMGPRAPVVLCLSNYVRQSLLRFYSMPPDRLATLFNAVDLKRFDPQLPTAVKRSPALALIVAQDFERKGLGQTIAALPNAAGLDLVVVGKDDPAPYRALADELGVVDRVRFAGPTADPWPYYRAADFFVLPTRHDPCSLVVLEALAMGVPVISTQANGACEIMTDGVHGFVLPDPDDVEALSAAMKKLMDPARRAEMSAACLALRPRLSYRHHLDELMRIYSSIKRSD